MLHTHDLADNLFARLEVSKPHAKQTPSENFCTEALVWCLRNTQAFRRAFIDHCATRLKSPVPSEILPEISSQVGARTTRNIPLRKRAQYDIELFFTNKRVLIEAKVDSAVDAKQLQLYTQLLKHEKIASSLLLLVSDAKKLPIGMPDVPTVFWEEIHQLAARCLADKGDPVEHFVLDQFAKFLESLGFLPVEINLSSETASSAAEVTAFLNSFQALLLKLKSNAELEAPQRTPALERDEKKKISWFGLHLAASRYKDGWVGLEFSHSGGPALLFEGVFSRTVLPLGDRLNGTVTTETEPDGTRLRLRTELESGSAVTAASIAKWITNTAAEFHNLGRRQKK